MKDPVYNQLREQSWRRKLTDAEEAELRAWLAAHPELRADWEAEAGLSEILGRLPDAPVPTNFTARVLQAVERESAAASPARVRSWKSWRLLLPKAAMAAMAIGFGLLAYQHYQTEKRVELARNVAAVSDIVAASNPDVVRDFDPIRRLGQTPTPDEELLAWSWLK